MWFRRRCVRLSPKCALSAILVCVGVSIVLTLAFGTDYHRGGGRGPWGGDGGGEAARRGHEDSTEEAGVPLDFIRHKDDRHGWKENLYIDDDPVEDHTVYHRRDQEVKGHGDPNGSDNDRQAMQVVSLLNMAPSVPSVRPIGKKVLAAQVELLREAIMEDARKEPSPSRTAEPQCGGGLESGEVEDLLCIPRPKFLERVKNPCWYATPAAHRLHCLPYFHILGCAKAGTTDLWNRLMAHPHLISNDGLLHKEALWWGWRRFGIYGYKKGVPQTFQTYVDLFQDTAGLVQQSLVNNNHYHHNLITGDASPPDFWDFRGWRNMSQNRGLQSPRVLTPHLMRHMYPDPRFILMFKDPVERLYSDYFFVGAGLTSKDFHRDIGQSISLLADCVRTHGIQHCFYDNALYSKMPVRLTFACYSIFMREWLRVFSLENFMFIKTEEYQEDPEVTLKKVMDFLKLHPLKESKLREIAEEEKSRITVQKQVAGPMKEGTKALLRRLLEPCNLQLAAMTRQPKFVWQS